MIQVFPVLYKSQFSRRFNESHRGIDIFSGENAPIIAVEKGKARSAIDDKGGLVVYLKADSGWSYYYAHLSSYEGYYPREVNTGDIIGYMGNTGNAINGPIHLHFQMKTPNGETVDPYDYLINIGEPYAPKVSTGNGQ